MNGWFEVIGIRSAAVRLLGTDAGKSPKHGGSVYAVEFGDGTVKVGKTIKPRDRMRGFDKTALSYGKPEITRIALSPIHRNFHQVEIMLHDDLSDVLIERELFRGSIEAVQRKLSTIEMDVIKSCRGPGAKGYFNLLTGIGSIPV